MRYQFAKTPKTVLFLHIPKTAGTTLDQIIYRHYRYREVYETGIMSHEGVEAFQKMTEAARARYRLLKGHMSFGLHCYVPGPWAYFTFLREPVDRTLSHFYYIQRNHTHPLYNLIHDHNMDIGQFLESRADPMLFNAHTRLLSGVWDSIPAGRCTREHLEMAKENLKNQIEVICLTERFDESLFFLRKAFGWNHLRYSRMNVTKKRPKKEILSPDVIVAVEEANQLDIELYEYGKGLFEAQVQQFGPTLAADIARFQFHNRLASPFVALYWETRKISLRVLIRKHILRRP